MPERILKLKAVPKGQRVETGALQFEGDWPGVFIRGDEAIGAAAQIRQVLPLIPAHDDTLRSRLSDLVRTLESCRV